MGNRFDGLRCATVIHTVVGCITSATTIICLHIVHLAQFNVHHKKFRYSVFKIQLWFTWFSWNQNSAPAYVITLGVWTMS
jgi:hypothetical protein